MPRPKRSKVAPSAPVGTQNHVSQPAPIASAAQKQQDIFSPESSGRVTNGSDDSDGLVVSKKTNTSKRTPMAQTYTMSGALAPEDIGEPRLKPPSGQTPAALSRIVREADHAKAKEEKARKAAEATSRAEPDQIPSSIPTNTVGSRRPSTTSKRSSARQSLQVGPGPRVQETPRLHSSSLLGGATFKKRPRQPSLLQMVQSRNNASDDLDDSDMYDFLPDDESTPLIKSLSQTNAQSKSSSSQQTSGSRKRKMKSPEIQVPASQSFDILSSPSAVPSQSDRQQSQSEEDDQPEPTLPPLRSTQTPQPQIFSDTLAPPQSSSPPPKPKPKPKDTRKKPAKAPSKAKAQHQKTQRKQFSLAPSPLSSTSTQISPVRPAKLKPLTTANLQNLLPRRRAQPKPKGDYDIPSSSDAELDNTALSEDEDELSIHATSKMRRKKQSMSMVTQKQAAKGKETGTGSKGKRVSKTHTRKSTNESGDENKSGSGSDDEDAGRNGTRGRSKTPALDGKAKAEMKRLADKFREVDEYTLDFEDVTGSSSQMKDAR